MSDIEVTIVDQSELVVVVREEAPIQVVEINQIAGPAGPPGPPGPTGPSGGVSSFNGRTGSVLPLAADYTPAFIGAAPASHVGAGGPSQHPIATDLEAGFMSPAQVSKLSGIAPSATSTVIESVTNPNPLGTPSPGSTGRASDSGHVHAHGNQAGGTLHALATPTENGFMPSADKSKLDAIAPSANLGITGLSGEAAAGLDGVTTLSNSAVIAKLLTGLSDLFGKPQSSDSILTATRKLSAHSTMSPNTISNNMSVPSDHTWIRQGRTIVAPGVKVTLEPNSRIIFI